MKRPTVKHTYSCCKLKQWLACDAENKCLEINLHKVTKQASRPRYLCKELQYQVKRCWVVRQTYLRDGNISLWIEKKPSEVQPYRVNCTLECKVHLKLIFG